MARIASTSELVTTISDLETSVSLPQGTVASKMDAVEINTLMQGVEDAFNKLYEKLRQLEDLHDFTKRYIQNEFKKNAAAFKKMTASIDKTTDTHENVVLQSMQASFENGVVVTDRDGMPIKAADFVGGKALIPASMTINQSEPESTIVNTNSVAYKRILTPASNYKTFYANEQPPAVPIQETLDLVYPRETEFNFLDVSAFNADIREASVTDENGIKIPINLSRHTMKRVKAKKVSLVLESTKNETQDVQMNYDARYDKDGSSYIDGIKSTIYETMIRNNGGTTFKS